jgi:hypothetical protein
MSFPRAIVLLLLSAAGASAQAPEANSTTIRNGGFESTYETENVWNGVNKEGVLSGFKQQMAALNVGGKIEEVPLPASPAVVDLNGDGLPDIIAADPLGYVRTYQNTGSPEQPKFGTGLLTTPYLGRPDEEAAPSLPGRPGARARLWADRNFGLRITTTEAGGTPSLVAGNWYGDIGFLRSTKSGQQITFPQPESVGKISLGFGPDSRRWGNLFAPLMHDFDGDGKMDLLVGEGSYSANNVHFFPNQGSDASPTFKMENRSVLALGEGRQHLTPTVADVNGDGKMDLLVSDNLGMVTAYLRPDNWQKGDSIKPSGYLSKNGGLTASPDDKAQALVLGSGIHTITAADLNADGLFDLVVGKPDGKLAWMPNKGTKEQPKFEAPSNLTGEKPSPASWRRPSQWEIYIGEDVGNFFAYANSVSAEEDPGAEPREGTRALKFGFSAANGSPLAAKIFPASKGVTIGDHVPRAHPTFFGAGAEWRILGASNRAFVIQQQLKLQVDKTYTFTFQYKGSGIAKANVFLGWWGWKSLGERKVTYGARGASKVENNHANEIDQISKDFGSSDAWKTFSQTFTVRFKDKNLKDVKSTHMAVLVIAFELRPPDGFLYLDDFQLVPQG